MNNLDFPGYTVMERVKADENTQGLLLQVINHKIEFALGRFGDVIKVNCWVNEKQVNKWPISYKNDELENAIKFIKTCCDAGNMVDNIFSDISGLS